MDIATGGAVADLGSVLLTLAALSPVSAEGTFDIPAGAHFNPQKLAAHR